MNLLRQFLPGQAPVQIAMQGEYEVIREKIFQTMMLITSAIGTLVYVFILVDAIRLSRWNSIIFYTLLLAVILSITVFRSLSYRLRVYTLLTFIFAGGIWAYSQNGLAGNGRIVFVAVTILSMVLISHRAGFFVLFLSLSTSLYFAYGMTTGFLPLPSSAAYTRSDIGRDWVIGIGFMAILSVMAVSAISVLMRSYLISLTKERRLSIELDQEKKKIEAGIQIQSQDLQRRVIQLRTAAEISRSISSVLDIQALLNQVVNLIVNRFDLYYVGVFLLDERSEYAELRAGTGDPGRRMIANQHRLQVSGNSMIGWCTANRKPRIALDVGDEAVRFNNPFLPDTRSELALPILSRNQVVGAMTIQSSQPNAFDENDILILQGIADSLATAIENASLFQQTENDLEEIQSLNRQFIQQAWTDVVDNYGQMAYVFDNNKTKTAGAIFPVSVPIVLRGEKIGEITLEKDKPELNTEEQSFVEAITSQAAIALESARLLQDTRRRAAQEEKVNQLTLGITRAVNIEDVLIRTLREIGQLPSVAEVSVHLAADQDNQKNEEMGGNGSARKGKEL
jgi:GAF domain-containing protein